MTQQVASLIDELERSLVYGRPISVCRRYGASPTCLWSGPALQQRQIGLFDEVIGKLSTAIEGKARAKLATRLSVVANAPGNLMRTLAADDDIEVARPVLTTSERLTTPN